MAELAGGHPTSFPGRTWGPLAVVGQGVPKVDAAPKALGQAQYVDDIALPNMLQGKLLRSPLPHARILRIDSSRARALPGVKAVITGEEIPKVKLGVFPHTADQYALAVEKVRHVGEAVAAVAAVDEETAQEAIELLRVDYEPLPAVFDPQQAMEAGAPAIHQETPDNVSVLRVKLLGDIDAGFAQADHIREDSFRIAAKAHAAMEPHGAIAQWHADGSLTIWTSSQTPFLFRRSLSRALGMAESRIRLLKPTVGGGFGGKNEVFAHEFAACWLARLTGRPVKIVLGREEVFLGTRGDFAFTITLRTGVRRDGTITAQENRALVDGGAYNSTAAIVVNNLCYFQMLPYIIPNYRFEGRHVYTNKPVGGPLRGHGIPQMRFAAESQMDMLAEDLGLDPADLRLRNAVYAGYPHPAKLRIASCAFQEALEAVVERMGWRERRGKLPPGRGIGIGCSAFPSGVRLLSSIGGEAVIKIDLDGGVHLLSGAADVGQGTDTVLCQMAAEELGLSTAEIALAPFDTDLVPFDLGTFGSGVTLRMGNAVLGAARDVKGQLLAVVAPRLEAEPQEVEFRGGRVYVRGSPERGMPFREAVRLYGDSGRPMPILGRGFYVPESDPVSLLLRGEDGNISPAYSFIAQGAEVEVDRETGAVKVLRVVTAHDCGRIINPITVEGQLDGSVMGGLGVALYEETPHAGGRPLTPAFLEYPLPTAPDAPAEIESIAIETVDPYGPFGAKEAGEGTMAPTPAAIANAIYDATGVRLTALPTNPGQLLRALREREAQGGGPR